VAYGEMYEQTKNVKKEMFSRRIPSREDFVFPFVGAVDSKALVK
jgi:hypothetical protein